MLAQPDQPAKRAAALAQDAIHSVAARDQFEFVIRHSSIDIHYSVICRISTPTTGWDPSNSGVLFCPRSGSTGGRNTQ